MTLCARTLGSKRARPSVHVPLHWRDRTRRPAPPMAGGIVLTRGWRAQRVALPVEAGEVRPPVTPHASPWDHHHAEKNVASFTQLTLFACRQLQSQHPLLENVRGNKIIKRDSSPPQMEFHPFTCHCYFDVLSVW